ncbi:MAG: 1,4-dihydroxy-6-naphthoate synthase [Pirellulales bacterium]
MMQTIRLGISTCPNDTFAFHGLMEQRVDWRGLNFEIELLDIQELNNHLFNEHFDVAKASFHAAILLANQYIVLPSGSALGFGVGPLLLSSTRNAFPSQHDQLTLCPGAQTTATLLYDMFYPDVTRVEHVVFSEIMPRLEQSQADFGVCIHEGRFTWEASGLFLVEDLGARWETETQCPLPLGGIIGKRSLGDDVLSQVQNVIRDSLHYGIANPEEPLATMRAHAQEFDDTVLMKHVSLYVNEWTVDLGSVGRKALDELSRRAHLGNDKQTGLQVFS